MKLNWFHLLLDCGVVSTRPSRPLARDGTRHYGSKNETESLEQRTLRRKNLEVTTQEIHREDNMDYCLPLHCISA